MDQKIWMDIINEIHMSNKKVYFDVYGNTSFQIVEETSDIYKVTLIK